MADLYPPGDLYPQNMSDDRCSLPALTASESQRNNSELSFRSDLRQIQAVLAEALGLSTEQIDPELAFGDLPQWDSMGHMEVMLRLEEHFGVEINNDTIANLTSIPAIRQYLEDGHGG